MSDINTGVLDSLKVLDPRRPIREADILANGPSRPSTKQKGRAPKDAAHQPGFSILRAGAGVALAEQVERIDIEIDIGGI